VVRGFDVAKEPLISKADYRMLSANGRSALGMARDQNKEEVVRSW
jgi:hypothetical protein